MKRLTERIYLLIAGVVMMLIGFYIAIMTIEYVDAMSAQNIKPGINMLSDLRGMGGMLLLFGSFVFISQFRTPWHQLGLMMAIAVYTSFVVFRSLGIILDGLPDMEIIIAYLIELFLAAFGIFLIKRKAFGATSKVIDL